MRNRFDRIERRVGHAAWDFRKSKPCEHRGRDRDCDREVNPTAINLPHADEEPANAGRKLFVALLHWFSSGTAYREEVSITKRNR